MFKRRKFDWDVSDPPQKRRVTASEVLLNLRFKPMIDMLIAHMILRESRKDIDPTELRMFAQRLDQMADRIERERAES